MTKVQGDNSLKDTDAEGVRKDRCPDCGQPKHEYWWDCEGPPVASFRDRLEGRRRKRVHSFIIK